MFVENKNVFTLQKNQFGYVPILLNNYIDK